MPGTKVVVEVRRPCFLSDFCGAFLVHAQRHVRVRQVLPVESAVFAVGVAVQRYRTVQASFPKRVVLEQSDRPLLSGRAFRRWGRGVWFGAVRCGSVQCSSRSNTGWVFVVLLKTVENCWGLWQLGCRGVAVGKLNMPMMGFQYASLLRKRT